MLRGPGGRREDFGRRGAGQATRSGGTEHLKDPDRDVALVAMEHLVELPAHGGENIEDALREVLLSAPEQDELHDGRLSYQQVGPGRCLSALANLADAPH